jgi:hypothetical protein
LLLDDAAETLGGVALSSLQPTSGKTR